jgi:transcriptional regulator with XRE-family HTH domain
MGRHTRNENLGRHFGENLVRCRKWVRLSQEELARGAALHRTEIGMLEHGRRVPSIETLIKVSRTLNIPEASLLDGIDWVPGADGGRGAFVFHAPLNPSMLRWIGDSDG